MARGSTARARFFCALRLECTNTRITEPPAPAGDDDTAAAETGALGDAHEGDAAAAAPETRDTLLRCGVGGDANSDEGAADFFLRLGETSGATDGDGEVADDAPTDA